MGAPPITHRIVPGSLPAARAAQSMERGNNGPVVLTTGDDGADPGYFVYIYNILNLAHVVEQPPLFPRLNIPPCPEGEKFSVIPMPAFVNERYEVPGSLPVEFRYKKFDGRKACTSLLNPSAFPGTDWEAQLRDLPPGDQTGNNLNLYGVFWSLTKPDDPALEKEIKLFRERVRKTMNELITEGERVAASGRLDLITPRMHFAMDYMKLSARWHMSHEHKIACPTCGETITAGLAYHKNSFGEKCIVDRERCIELGIKLPGKPKEVEV
jgi:hypothetical protein